VNFRTRLLLLIVLVVFAAVGVVTWTVSSSTTRAFESLDEQRLASLNAQFRREYARYGDEVVQRLERVVASEQVLRLAIDLDRAEPNTAEHVDDASALARSHGLEFLEIAGPDGTIISSAQWPARFGYRAAWVAQSRPAGAFLRREELADRTEIALVSVREVSAAGKSILISGGQPLDSRFLRALLLPAGTRALLYSNLRPEFSPSLLVDVSGPAADAAGLLRSSIERSLQTNVEYSAAIKGPETVQAIPLDGGDGQPLAVLLFGSSRAELAALVGRIRIAGYLIGGAGILLGIALSYWVTARVTRPLALLASAARRVAGGDWDARVEIRSQDEIGQLAGAFNAMTSQLRDQRDRLVQAERVAAWRELARRLAHELKNPLFPLQITVENLQRSRKLTEPQFEEVFQESTGTLLAELGKLKTIIGRFSDFAKMPQPQLEPVDLNRLAAGTLRLFEAQLTAEGRPRIEIETSFEDGLGPVPADPEQLGRALQNLVLNAVDAMPNGGRLAVRTRGNGDTAILEVSDSGAGLTPEESERLFTPYYTTKQHGTGLGLAIVQSVVSDHHGKISVESERGRGTTFRIELSQHPHEPRADS
jgi:two-component system, NtrC family, nitrogen regulation sensor histidine kinase NtrY